MEKEEKSKETKVYIDPPGGWKYGFPKVLPREITDVREWLLQQGYPQKDIDLAMRCSSIWEE